MVAVPSRPKTNTKADVRYHEFGKSTPYSVGIEEEFQIVDKDTYQLVPRVEDVLKNSRDDYAGKYIKHELLQSVVETSTCVCTNMAQAKEEIGKLRSELIEAADKSGAALLSAGTSPNSRWEDQVITDQPRYRDIVANLQWIARRELIFGLHVHVGVDSPEKCMYVFRRMREQLPILLAMSANSPFWQGEVSGLRSSRIKVFDAFPRSGMPADFPGGWEEFCTLIERGQRTRVLEDHTYIWWDVRPHPGFGTIEVRICDAQTSSKNTLALAALIQAMVFNFGGEFDRGNLGFTPPEKLLIEDNRWSAARYGLDGEMVNFSTDERESARVLAKNLISSLESSFESLGSTPFLDDIYAMIDRSGATEQLAVWARENNSLKEVAKSLDISRNL